MTSSAIAQALGNWGPSVETAIRSLGVGRHSESLRSVELFQGRDGRLSLRYADAKSPTVAPVLQAVSFCQTHRHYKGGAYELLQFADLEDEEYAVYRNAAGELWFRPAEMFKGQLEDGTIRFAAIH